MREMHGIRRQSSLRCRWTISVVWVAELLLQRKQMTAP
jgi:hypothetical protein